MRLPRLRAVLPALPRLSARRSDPVISYEPALDGTPDPGEVVWAWVPFQEDPTQGKDRPVLIIGRDGPELLTLPLTSKDHDRDADQEASQGRHWMDVGRGTWDRQRRPSEVRLDRMVRLHESDVRREGAILPRSIFDQVVTAAREHHAF